MDSTIDNLSKPSQTLADKATDKADQLRSEATPIVKKAANQARSTLKQGYATVTDFAGLARDAASDASDSVVAFTKKNPAAALAIAAATGALLYAAARALSSRD
jgi:ElaB/YqjD/DUF883 family membrane-anchored ribosome-binding protein